MGFIRKVKYIEISLQHKEDVQKAIEHNIQNNYEYIIVDYNNLINYDNLALLLRYGYELQIYSDIVKLVHKKYNKEIEKIEKEESAEEIPQF